MSYDEKTRQTSAKKAHSMSMEGRSRLSVSGVEEVESFDEREIVMITGCGSMIIRGEELSISRLSLRTLA